MPINFLVPCLSLMIELTYPEFNFESEAKVDNSTGVHETKAVTV